MGSFNGFLDAEFRPPRNWSLISSLKFKQQVQLQFQKDTLQTWHQFLEFVGHS